VNHTGDDEYDIYKAQIGQNMRQRLGIGQNPLDGARARVRSCLSFRYVIVSNSTRPADGEITIHVPILPESRVHTVPDIGRQEGKDFFTL
jgi:hypothetical protein